MSRFAGPVHQLEDTDNEQLDKKTIATHISAPLAAGMAGQGDAGAARQSSRAPRPTVATSNEAAAASAAAARSIPAMLREAGWTLFSAQWFGTTLVWRVLVGCAVLLAAAHVGSCVEVLNWNKAEESIVVYRGVLVLVIPFLLSPALSSTSLWRLTPRVPFHFKVTGLGVAPHRNTSEAALATLDSMAEGDGADVAGWLRTLRDAGALPPTTMARGIDNKPSTDVESPLLLRASLRAFTLKLSHSPTSARVLVFNDPPACWSRCATLPGPTKPYGGATCWEASGVTWATEEAPAPCSPTTPPPTTGTGHQSLATLKGTEMETTRSQGTGTQKVKAAPWWLFLSCTWWMECRGKLCAQQPGRGSGARMR